MSRTGDCYDNAVAESFFATLKAEHVDHEDFATRDLGTAPSATTSKASTTALGGIRMSATSARLNFN